MSRHCLFSNKESSARNPEVLGMCKIYYRVPRNCLFSNGSVHCCQNGCFNGSGVKSIYERTYFTYDQYVLHINFKYMAKEV